MTAHRRPKGEAEDLPVDSRISWIEVIGYTSVILMIALLMSGIVDVMLPWS